VLFANNLIDKLEEDLACLSVAGVFSCNWLSSDKASDSSATLSSASHRQAFPISDGSSPERPVFDESISKLAYGDVLAWQQAASCADVGDSDSFDAPERVGEFWAKEDESNTLPQTESIGDVYSGSEQKTSKVVSEVTSLEQQLWGEEGTAPAGSTTEVNGDSLSMVSEDNSLLYICIIIFSFRMFNTTYICCCKYLVLILLRCFDIHSFSRF